METTPFELLLKRPPCSLILSGSVPQDAKSHMKNPRTLLQYKRAKLRKLWDALDRARTTLSASQKRDKDNFDGKVRFRPVVSTGDFVYVDRLLCPLKRFERRTRLQDSAGTEGLSGKLLLRTTGLFRVRYHTDTMGLIEQDGMEKA